MNRFAALAGIAVSLNAYSCQPVEEAKPAPPLDQSGPSSPDCDCDASIDKVLSEPLTPGGQGAYTLFVDYYGNEHCDDGQLCVQDVLPAGLTYSSYSGSAWNCSSGDGITVDCCFTAGLPDNPVSLIPIEIIVDVDADASGEIENCATILQGDHYFEDGNEANNTSCDVSDVSCGDLDEALDTGFDDDASVSLAPEALEDDWLLIVDDAGGVVPRAPIVVNPYGGWLAAMGSSMWLSPTSNGSGTAGWSSSGDHYTYERCFCLAEDFSDPSLWLDVRADDAAIAVRLNGATLTPTAGTAGSYNDPQALEFSESDASAYKVGRNCVQIDVFDSHGVVTGLDVQGNIAALDGHCCEIEAPVHDLSIQKTTEELSFSQGGLGTYTMTVTNEGSVPESAFTVIDPLAIDLLFVSNTNTAEWSCSAAPATPPQVVSCSYIGPPLAPGDSTSFDLIVQLADPAVWSGAKEIHNCADVAGEFNDSDPSDNSSCISTPVPCDDLREDLSTGFDNGTATVTPLGDFDDDWQLVVDASGAPVPSSPTVVSAYPGWLPAFVGSGWLSNAEDGSAAHRALFTSAGIYTYERCWCMSGYAIDPLLGLLARGDNEITDVRLNGVSLVPVAGTIGAFNDAQPMEYEVTDSTMFLPGENCVQVDLDNWGSVAGLNVSGSIFADDGACCEITPAGDDADSP